MKIWCVYLLQCLDNSYYTGITNDLEKRMLIHKSGKGSKYVKIRGFDKLLNFKQCKNKSDALKIEYKIKQLPRQDKLAFFNS